ncbi:enoyl-ACP reductase FabI [Luteimonas fraxinea]|uniref:enoyl-ACP reductase FabI n=1 Tax=Luteimonas fraxinea TaxID=2901869 RepID=UPI001E480642|nr:enoyl-ACP reductase FabI [Luteimonas fraxinea]MCD9126386.1 enoyl-ACP reductase FabI [Luteimonas fraxinea]UHH11412.1 enoyl-ACP reductase FabI [Luteimonas fraxinea]
MNGPLHGKRGLVIGIANDRSIGWGCAQALRDAGAELAATWQDERARPHVAPLLEGLPVTIAQPLDVRAPAQMQALFDAIATRWGSLDFLVHSVAFAPRQDLHGRVVDSSADGFALAMDVSCHSFIRLAKLAEPLMPHGGSLVTMSYLGAEDVVDRYGLMGPVKAALESSVRYLAAELGPAGIRVNAISPGPVDTRAASGLAGFEALLAQAEQRAPMRRLVGIDEVGALCAFLVGEGARSITGDTHYLDAGFHLLS